MSVGLAWPCLMLPFWGLSRPALVGLLGELREPWVAKAEGQRRARRGRSRLRRSGAGRAYRLGFEDRVLVTLVVLRFQLPHSCLAALFGVDRAMITRAVHQIRPLLAARGFQTPHGPRLRTLADVFAYANQHGVQLRIDGTEVQVRRPAAGRPGRRAFVSGKKKQNTMKFTLITSHTGPVLWWGAPGPAGCTTRLPSAPRASPSNFAYTRTCECSWMPATEDWSMSSRIRSPAHRNDREDDRSRDHRRARDGTKSTVLGTDQR